MYTLKEKKKHIADLFCPDCASVDCDLLASLAPAESSLPSFKNFPKRNAEDILYHLLDVTTREKIVENRRKVSKAEEEQRKAEEEQRKVEEEQRKAEEEQRKADAEERVSDAENRADEAEAALKEEKKKEPIKRSRSTKNTQTSNGTTSKTKKSK